MSLLGELQRRNVFKVAVAYAIVGWLLIQVAGTVLPIFEAPRWIIQVFTFLVFLGFPLALLLSWAYELTPEGIKPVQRDRSEQNGKFETRHSFQVLTVGLLLGALLGGGSVWFLNRNSAQRLSVGDLKTQIEQYRQAEEYEAAFASARQLQAMAPNDPELQNIWSAVSIPYDVSTEPAGAHVYRRAYDAVDREWEDLGIAPLENIRLPLGLSRLRFELEGYEPVFRTQLGNPLAAQTVANVALDRTESLPDGMIRVPGWTEDSVAGERTRFDDFFLGRDEVSNREFKAFVDAGGYQQPEFWPQPIVGDDGEIPWAQAMKLFVDRTGRPGPSTWEAGDYPDGQEDYPVAGVSWYEAAAYAKFVRQELPSVYHWRRAFMSGLINGLPWMAPASNLEADSMAPAEEFQGMSWAGAFDMAGNAREWVLNGKGDRRFILGGGWNDPYFVGVDTNFVQPPLDRSATNGFRLAITRDEAGTMARARLPLPDTDRDFTTEKPISDELFETYKRIYSYDSAPLNATVEDTDSNRTWKRERIAFDAAYGEERMILYLYLPVGGSPPYQTVLYWPAIVFFLDSIDDYAIDEYLVKDGRALAFPVYKGIFERGDRSPFPNPSSSAFREATIQWINDLRRSIDYLETRTDIDPTRFGYVGVSWGAEKAPLALSMEPRLRAAVVTVGGVFYNLSLMQGRYLPEVDPATYLPRVDVPVLLLTGEFDSIVPLETSAKPYHELLGTAEPDKKQLIAPGGHFVPRELRIRETLDWFDKYLGPVTR